MFLSFTLTGKIIGPKCRSSHKVIKVSSTFALRFFSVTRPCSWKILFFGNDTFSLESLKALKNLQNSNVIAHLEVVTSAATNNPVRNYALTNNIPSHCWPYEINTNEDFDLGVVASFGYLIPKNIILKFPLGMVNVHASLLPRWRGASPISYAILHGDSKTGVTIMKIRPYRFDVGEIISQSEVNIEENESYSTLLQKLANLGANELAKCVINLPDNLETAKAQDNEGVTYAPRITKEMAEVNFKTMDATTIYTLERAISPLFPLSTNWLDTPVRLLGVVPYKCSLSPAVPPQHGFIRFNKKTKIIQVECRDRTCITFSKIVIHKRSPLSSLDFYNGFLSKTPETLRFFRMCRRTFVSN